jgi:uncharacterized protein
MKTLTRDLRPFEVKAVDESSRTFEGLAATWDLDLGGDVIHKGAFRQTLDYWRTKGFAVPLIDQHRYTSIHDVLGSMVDAEERDEGLWARFEVDEDADGDKLLRHIKNKRINGLSIGYEAVNPERDEHGIRHLREVRLYEVSAVLWPMNPAATIDAGSVKSLTSDDAALAALSDDEVKALLGRLDVEAKARAEAATPKLSSEQADALRARLLSLRLRPLLSGTSGQNSNAA